jgi:Flp pilus assembly protein TadG
MCVLRNIRHFRERDDGNATIEFVILFPAFIFLFLTGFEAGYYMVRNVVLERATDIAIRDVRLSNGAIPNWADLKQRICNEAAIIPDCEQTIQIEMQVLPKTPGGVASVANGPIRCIDTGAPPGANQQGAYAVGAENQLMLVRICSLSQPLFPTTGIGVGMKKDAQGNYALVTTTAFVNEPGNRAMTPTGNGNGNSSNTNGNSGNSSGNGSLTTSGNQGNGNGANN